MGGGGAGSLTRDDPSAFAPPPAFGPFRVLHQIGVGALGPVFRTYEPTRDRLVAVKVFRLDITPEQAQSLAGELSRATEGGLFHPSIVEPIAADVERTVAYRAEEYVAAETLDVAMRHYAPAGVDKVLPFITQLAGAIDFARGAGVGHGALHPRDVFVTPEEARATGFGVVEALERVGLRAPIRRPYSAPERIEGSGWGTPADVFSLAAIAYELLTGRRPSGTGAEIGTLSGAATVEHADALLAVLALAMDRDPSRRYPTALAFAAALEGAARGERSSLSLGAPPAGTGAPAAAVSAAAKPEPRQAASQELPEPAGAAAIAADTRPDIEDDDDIAGERDEDEAHFELTRHEANERERAEAADATMFADEEPEAAADRLLIDAAAVASDDAQERYGSELQKEAPNSWNVDRRRDVVDRDVDYRTGGVVPVQGPRLVPLVVTLSIGLLVGFAVGYGVGSREPGPEGGGVANQAPSAQAPAGKDWSEQTVAQPPAVARQQPSTTPPPVPTEAPQEPAAAASRPAITGRLVVRSTPGRAAVTVNGRWRGRTPLTVEQLPFGKHTVRVVQPGYVVAHDEVALSARDPARTLSFRLQPEAARTTGTGRPAPAARQDAGNLTGSIYVDSRPRGASVFVDGRAVGTTPLSVSEVPVGSHVVRLELPDHKPWTASRQVTAGRQERVTGSLERIR